MQFNRSYIRTVDDEIGDLGVELLDLQARFLCPSWMWLDSELHEFIVRRIQIRKRLRKLKEDTGYNCTAAE